jgi:hypothetical protein
MISDRIVRLQIEHDVDGHARPVWQCPDCDSLLHAGMRQARAEQGDILGYCHAPGIDHAWYHKHGSSWCRPAEARGFA